MIMSRLLIFLVAVGAFNAQVRACEYAGEKYDQGSMVKQGDDKLYRCNDGGWEPGGDAAQSGLSVASAWYGFNKGIDVTSRVKELCDGKAACEFPATNDFFGSDPEPGIKKELHIKWTCSSSPEAKDDMKVEGTTLRLSCP